MSPIEDNDDDVGNTPDRFLPLVNSRPVAVRRHHIHRTIAQRSTLHASAPYTPTIYSVVSYHAKYPVLAILCGRCDRQLYERSLVEVVDWSHL